MGVDDLPFAARNFRKSLSHLLLDATSHRVEIPRRLLPQNDRILVRQSHLPRTKEQLAALPRPLFPLGRLLGHVDAELLDRPHVVSVRGSGVIPRAKRRHRHVQVLEGVDVRRRTLAIVAAAAVDDESRSPAEGGRYPPHQISIRRLHRRRELPPRHHERQAERRSVDVILAAVEAVVVSARFGERGRVDAVEEGVALQLAGRRHPLRR
mmetsp:Transcript_17827/g.38557  ORF Transcript_17827/g.38557 Transcript_17827/m.38557 type:complete len:209 (-) Transcript_17827:317-943(-)